MFGTWNPGGAPLITGDGPTVLYAYSTDDLSHPLYSSDLNPEDAAGNAVKFAVPTVANGRVFVGTDTEISVYGRRAETVDTNSLTLFPNPINTNQVKNLTLYPQGVILEKQEVLITSVTGRVVMKTVADFSNAQKVQIDVSSLMPGMYILTLTKPNGELMKARFIRN